MGEFLLGGVLGFVFVACIAAPFLAPWRVRIRYLVNAGVIARLDGWSATRTPLLNL